MLNKIQKQCESSVNDEMRKDHQYQDIFDTFLYDKDKESFIENICQKIDEKIVNRKLRKTIKDNVYDILME